MHKFAIAAAAAVMALTGTAAIAQMDRSHTTTTMQDPMGNRTTTTTRTMDRSMDGQNGNRTMERTTVRTHHSRGDMRDNRQMRNGHDMRGTNRSWHSNRTHCKTWWSHGRKMRNCKTMMRHHM